jgi:AAA+ ATPase superfamily predicted ATPase
MKNPFEYGGVVSGDAFCNREKEVADLLQAIENNEKLFVFSERRYGKTSLVRTALGKLPKKGCVCAYVDLWPTDSEAAFVTAVAKAITESTSTSVDKVLETAKRFFGSLAPSVTVDEEGKPCSRSESASTPNSGRRWMKCWKPRPRLRQRAS